MSKTLTVVQVVRYSEPHHGWKFCTVCHDHLEEVSNADTPLASQHEKGHKIDPLLLVSNYSINSI